MHTIIFFFSRSSNRAIIAALLLLHSFAFTRGTNGVLEGKIHDKQTKQALLGVNVVVVGTKSGGVSDVDGYYYVNALRGGVYSIRVSLLGYKNVIVKNVTIIPESRTRIDVELEQSSLEMETIEIHAEQPLIQKQQAATSFYVSDTKLRALPVATFQEAVSLQPGTTSEGNVRGGKTTELVYFVDGLPVQDVIGGGLGTSLPKSSITALTVFTGGFTAEYGNALSGVVNVITKSGTDHHLFNARLERDSWLPQNLNEQQNRATELEVSGGGPIEGEKFNYFNAHVISYSDTRWWQDFRHFIHSPVDREFSGIGKVEYNYSPTFKMYLQGIYSIHQWHDYEYSWRYDLNGLPIRHRDSYRMALNLSNTISDNSYYTLSLSRFFLRSQIGEGPASSLSLQPYEYDLLLRYVIGGARNWLADSRQVTYTLKGDYSYLIGKVHSFKAGFELNQYDIFSSLIKYEPQKTYFGKPILNAPLLNYSNSYNYYPRSGSVFVQHKIQGEDDESNLSFGVRWDFLDPTAERPIVEYIPISGNQFRDTIKGTTRAKFKQQFSPRIALGAPLSPKVFFFVNYGRYFQFPLFDYLYSGINPVNLREGVKNVLTGNPDLNPERTVAWEFGLKYSINENVMATATYFQKRIEDQIDTKTLVPFDSKFSGDYGFASYVNNASAYARGFELLLNRENYEYLSGNISYAYMVTEGISEYADQRLNFAQWGFPLYPTTFPLSWDQRHTIKLDVDSKLPWGIHANVVVLYNSPRPFTYFPTRDGITPLDSNQIFIPNNARMENVVFVNMKLTKEIVLDEEQHTVLTFYADVKNLLNRANVKWIDSNGKIGGELSDPGAYSEPRRMRIGARIEF